MSRAAKPTAVCARLEATRAYVEGCDRGRSRALGWLADPRRGDPLFAGTLQQHVLVLAGNLAVASNLIERENVRGEIVGFCYAIECPSDATELQAAARRRPQVDQPGLSGGVDAGGAQ